jgi:hypothetical protein
MEGQAVPGTIGRLRCDGFPVFGNCVALAISRVRLPPFFGQLSQYLGGAGREPAQIFCALV